MGATSFENVTCSGAAALAGLASVARAEICATIAINIVSTMPTADRCRGFDMVIIRVTPQPNARKINAAPQASRALIQDLLPSKPDSSAGALISGLPRSFWHQVINSFTTRPATSVNRKLRPLYLN